MAQFDPVEAVASDQAASAGRQAVLDLVKQILTEMLRDQERDLAGPIGAQTLLGGDLGCQSLDTVMLIGALNRLLLLVDIPFEQLLFANGRPVADLSVQQIADFMWARLRSRSVPAKATPRQ